MNCNNNGKTFVVSLTTVPGGTAANASYLLALDHYTCGNKKLCTSETYPVTADLKATALGSPVDVGNGAYCQEVLISGSVTYMPFKCGCQCGVCPISEGIYTTICVPCSAATTPTLTIGTSQAAPTNVQPCSTITNCVAVTTTLNVTTGA
jgi:hypothetical protein